MHGFVIFSSSVMTPFLFYPLPKATSRFTQCKSVGININFCVGFCCGSFYKQVIIATGNIIVCCKTLMPEKHRFFITQVAANTHIRFACQGIRKILHSSMKSFPAYQFIQQSPFFFLFTIAQNNFGTVIVCFLHFVNPALAGRYTISVG